MCDHWSLTIYVAHICPMLKFQDGKKTLSLKNACPCFQMEFSHSITSQSLRDTGIQLVQVFQLKHQTSAEGGKPNTVRLYFHVRSDMASISKHEQARKLERCATLRWNLQTAVKLAHSQNCRPQSRKKSKWNLCNCDCCKTHRDHCRPQRWKNSKRSYIYTVSSILLGRHNTMK